MTSLNDVLQIGFTGRLIDWSTLIHFINDNHSTLENDVLIRLFELSEQYRNFFNTERLEPKRIEKNGKIITVQTRKKPLNIRTEDVYPKIYQYYPNLELNLEPKKNNNILQEEEPVKESQLTGWVVSLAREVKGSVDPAWNTTEIAR